MLSLSRTYQLSGRLSRRIHPTTLEVGDFYDKMLNQDGDALVVTENHYVPAALQLDDDGYDDYVRITIEEEGYIREWYPPLVQQLYKP